MIEYMATHKQRSYVTHLLETKETPMFYDGMEFLGSDTELKRSATKKQASILIGALVKMKDKE